MPTGVFRALARQYADTFDRATRLFQFALQARAGTDCLAAMLRAASELDADATIVSLDGRSAYDTVSRAAFLKKLREVAPALVPYVRAWYGGTSTYLWWDAEGRRHEISQGDGCEQGDALAPALYSLAQHDALAAAQGRLQPGEFLAAFLDDLYLVTTPARARSALDDVTRTVERQAGVAANLGKTRVYRASGGPPPPDIAVLGPEVWCGGDSEPATCGFVALGVPIGHTEFVRRTLAARLEEERRLLHELPELPDMQSAWLLLLYCASPRAQHALRTVPPLDSATYAAEHDRAIWATLHHLLAEQDASGREWTAARQIAFLPAACGGLGLASAERLAPAAYWAAWADALPVMLQRRPEVARRYAQELALGGGSTAPCLRAAAEAGDRLLAEGRARPEWDALLHGARPPPTHAEPSEPGSWPHGWQKPAACVLNKSYRERLLCSLPPSSRALLRSQAGAHAGEWLRAIPTDEDGRGHAASAAGHASRSPATPSLAATHGIFPLRRTWRARVPSRGGPAGRPSRCLRPEWAAGPARSHTRASVGPSSAGGRRRRRAGGPPTMASADHRSGRSPR